MSPSPEHPHIAPVVRALQSFNEGDDETLFTILAPDIVWHVGGRNPMSGTHRGPEAVLAVHQMIHTLFGQPKVAPHDILASDEHVVVLARVSLTAGGEPYTGNLGYIFHVSDGIITEGWVIQEDQAAWDDVCARSVDRVDAGRA